MKTLTKALTLCLSIFFLSAQSSLAAGNAPTPAKPHVIIVSSLTCHGCYKFLMGDDHKKIQDMEEQGLISVEYMPYIHDGACLVGTCIAASEGPDHFAKNYLFLIERQKDWTSKKWQKNIKELAADELHLTQMQIDDAFRENSDIQNKFILNHISFSKKYPLKFVPCLVVNGSIVEAEYIRLMEHPDMKRVMGNHPAQQPEGNPSVKMITRPAQQPQGNPSPSPTAQASKNEPH